MGAALTECRKYLETRYRNLLGLQTGFSEAIQSQNPAWLNVSMEDLGRTSKQAERAAVLVDPEIGTLLYLIEYEKDQDIVALIVKALSLRTRLLLGKDKSTESLSRDPLGSWRIAVYWLIENELLLRSWEAAVAQLRADAPHTEEIPIDSINKGKDNWSAALQAHGLPRLLLNTRRVLRIGNRREVERWSAADSLVEDELKGFSGKFGERTQRELALLVEQKLQSLKDQQPSGADKVPTSVGAFRLPHTIGVRNFRNVREATIDLASDTVLCSVIAGPNGSGKSTMFEAISLATFGSSNRYLEYLQDGDAGSRRSPEDYVARYLKNLWFQEWGLPQFSVGDAWDAIRLPQSEADAESIDNASKACLLSQEKSADFCRRTSSELAAEVLSGYSDLAIGVQWYVEDEYQKANLQRQDLLRSLGLRANITKVDTAHQKVAEQQLLNAVQVTTTSIVAWLSAAAKEFSDFLPATERTARLWQRWEERRADVAAECVVLLEEEPAKGGIARWLAEYNAAVDETKKVLGGRVSALVEHIRSGGTSISDQISTWGDWLEQQANGQPGRNEAAIASAKAEQDALTKRQAELTRRGSLTRARLDHLLATSSGIENKWIERHAQTCPTCNSDLAERGGFKKVIDDLVAETTNERDNLEKEFRDISRKIREINESLTTLGVAANPIDDDQQQVLVSLVGPFLAGGVTLQEMLKSSSSRERLVAFIAHLRMSPTVPVAIEEENASRKVAKEIVELCWEVSKTFDAPNNWAAVRKRVTESLGDVVRSHLPKTIGALWLEIALNLTAAPWLLRLKPSFHARTQRNSQSLTIRMGSDEAAPLARHILNQAEVDILGLAWFFVRFVTSGRFVLPLLVLDDPAQQMDQTTYRDLCRMLETIVRIHRKNGARLALVVLFHQEDRALDAARALNATLTVLSWAQTQSSNSIRRIKLFGDSQPLTPASVLS